MDKYLKVAVLLTAVDQMSGVVKNAAGKAMTEMQQLRMSMRNNFTSGLMMYGAGRQLIKSAVMPYIDAASQISDAQANLRGMILDSKGVLDVGLYGQLSAKAEEWSNKFGGAESSYLDMIRTMKENSIDPKDLLGQLGDEIGQISALFDAAPSEAGLFSARMRRDMAVSNDEMKGMLDTMARLKGIGMGMNGPDAIHNMTEFFSRAGISMQNMGVHGLKAGQDMATLGAIFMRTGLSGELVGTNLRRIFAGMSDPKKMQETAQAAAAVGRNLNFFKDGKFVGVDSFVKQLNSLKGLSVPQIAAILKPIGGGKQGFGQDFLTMIADRGLENYQEILNAAKSQGDFQQKFNEKLQSANMQMAIYRERWQNLKIDIGTQLMPAFIKLMQIVGRVLEGLQSFAKAHPILTKLAIGGVAVAGAFLMVGGALRIMKAAWEGLALLKMIGEAKSFGTIFMWGHIAVERLAMGFLRAIPAVTEFGAALWASPLTWYIAAAIAAAGAVFLIWRHWDTVSKWLVKIWDYIKTGVSAAFNFIKRLFWDWNPLVIFVNHFNNIFNYVSGLGGKFYDAGKALIIGLAKGIASAAMWPLREAMKIWDKIKGIWSGNHSTTLRTYYSGSNLVPALSPSGSSSISSIASNSHATAYHFSPTINMSGSASEKDAQRIADNLKPHFDRWLRENEAQRRRVRFSS